MELFFELGVGVEGRIPVLGAHPPVPKSLGGDGGNTLLQLSSTVKLDGRVSESDSNVADILLRRIFQ